jgi:AcrR family transcriptional regulator
MNKHEENSKQTRQNLIDAFWALYSEKRIEKITVREITQKAGYNRGTFYEYFVDVHDVLEQIESSLIPGLNELPPATIQGKNLGMPLDLFISLYEKKSHYYAVLLGKNGDPAFPAKLKDSIKPVLQSVVSRPPDLSETEFDFVLEYVLSAMIGVMGYWFEKDKPLSAENLISLLNRLMQNGVTGSALHFQ